MADINTLLLLHGEDIRDKSGYKRTITNSGVTVSAAQSKFGGKSLYFSGSACLSITSNLFSICNGDFTIDWWQYRQNTGTLGCFNVLNAAGFSQFLIQHGGGTKLYGSYTGSTWDAVVGASAFNLKQNAWEHCAIVKSGTTVTAYQNGVKVWSGTVSNSFAAGTGEVLIGCHADPSNRDYFNGYIDEFRISNVARWTSNFTPPTEPYLSGGGASNIANGYYGINEGKALVNGTVYTVNEGKTLVGGAAYTVPLASNFQEEEATVYATWQKWNVSTVYTYTADRSTATFQQSASASSYTTIRYTTTTPVAKSGQFTSKPSVMWANTFKNTGITANKFPYTTTSAGWYAFYYGSGYAILSTLYYFEENVVISGNDSGNAIIPKGTPIYTLTEHTPKVKGTTQYENVVAEEGTYPDNGVSGDYWYVKIS